MVWLSFLAILSLLQSAAGSFIGRIWLVNDVSKTIKLLVEGELLQQQYRYKEERVALKIMNL